MVRPDCVANDRARETKTLEARKIRQIQHGSALQRRDRFNNLTMPVDLSLDRAQLGFEDARDPEHPALSGKKQKQLLQDLQDTATKVVSGPLLKETKIKFGAALDQHFSLSVDPNDAQT